MRKGISAAMWLLSAAGLAGFLLAQESGLNEEKIQTGKKLFVEFGCFICHGQEGKGGIKNPNAVGGEVPSLIKVAEGYNVEELRKKILEGVPKVDKKDPNGADPPLFMLSWKEVLSQEQIDSLIVYLMNLTPKSKQEEW